MKCSHGLVYEVKCGQCFAEAMALYPAKKTSGVQKSVAAGSDTAGFKLHDFGHRGVSPEAMTEPAGLFHLHQESVDHIRN